MRKDREIRLGRRIEVRHGNGHIGLARRIAAAAGRGWLRLLHRKLRLLLRRHDLWLRRLYRSCATRSVGLQHAGRGPIPTNFGNTAKLVCESHKEKNMQHSRPYLLKRHPPVIRVRRIKRDQFHKPLWLFSRLFVVKKNLRLHLLQSRSLELRSCFIQRREPGVPESGPAKDASRQQIGSASGSFCFLFLVPAPEVSNLCLIPPTPSR